MSAKKAVSDAELRRRHEVQLKNLAKARDVRQQKLAAKNPKRLASAVKPRPFVKPAPTPNPPSPDTKGSGRYHRIQKTSTTTTGTAFKEHSTTCEFTETSATSSCSSQTNHAKDS